MFAVLGGCVVVVVVVGGRVVVVGARVVVVEARVVVVVAARVEVVVLVAGRVPLVTVDVVLVAGFVVVVDGPPVLGFGCRRVALDSDFELMTDDEVAEAREAACRVELVGAPA